MRRGRESFVFVKITFPSVCPGPGCFVCRLCFCSQKSASHRPPLPGGPLDFPGLPTQTQVLLSRTGAKSRGTNTEVISSLPPPPSLQGYCTCLSLGCFGKLEGSGFSVHKLKCVGVSEPPVQ